MSDVVVKTSALDVARTKIPVPTRAFELSNCMACCLLNLALQVSHQIKVRVNRQSNVRKDHNSQHKQYLILSTYF